VDRQTGAITPDAVESLLTAYTEALERILGVPAGSLVLVEPATLREWYA